MSSDKPRSLPKLGGDDDEPVLERTTQVKSASGRDLAHERARIAAVQTYLIVLFGPTAGRMVKLPPHEAIIGRAQDALLRVADDGVSRHHARLAQEAGVTYVEDLKSANGTFVNGEPIAPQERRALRDGDKIQIGPATILKFTVTDGLDEDFLKGMYDAANRDSLTGLHNRRAFSERLTSEFAFARRKRAALSVAMIDVDFFKNVNDTYGHLGGDAVLAAIGHMLGSTMRTEDFAARYGGEEFAVLVRGTGPESNVLCERLRERMQALSVAYEGEIIKTTFSVGVASYPETAIQSGDELVAMADAALYEAKSSGRNRVVVRTVVPT